MKMRKTMVLLGLLVASAGAFVASSAWAGSKNPLVFKVTCPDPAICDQHKIPKEKTLVMTPKDIVCVRHGWKYYPAPVEGSTEETFFVFDNDPANKNNASKRLYQLTKKSVGLYMSISLDGQVLSEEMINEPLGYRIQTDGVDERTYEKIKSAMSVRECVEADYDS